MPTPAKLVCAILFAALCWYTVGLIIETRLPEGRQTGNFRLWVTIGGLLVGWSYIGKRASGPTNSGTNITIAMTAGIGGALVLGGLGLILNSFTALITTSLAGGVYTEIGQGIDAWVEFFFRDFRIIADPIVLGTFFGGAAAIGLIGGIVGRNLR